MCTNYSLSIALQVLVIPTDEELSIAQHCCLQTCTNYALSNYTLQVLVIPTDEELSIAQQTVEVIRQSQGVAAAA